jgi:hypothetical protein
VEGLNYSASVGYNGEDRHRFEFSAGRHDGHLLQRKSRRLVSSKLGHKDSGVVVLVERFETGRQNAKHEAVEGGFFAKGVKASNRHNVLNQLGLFENRVEFRCDALSDFFE